MRRREVLALAALASIPSVRASAQGVPRPARIAFLVAGPEVAVASRDDLRWLMDGLREAGLTEGADFALDTAYADGDYGRFPRLAAELLAREPRAVLVTTIASAKAAQALTTTVPIVMMGLNDPVGVGLVADLARPGGNVTGVATLNEDLQLKMLQMLREILPKAKAVAFLWNPLNASNARMLGSLRAEAAARGIESSTVEVPTPESLDAAFAEMARLRPDGLLVVPDAGLVALARPIALRAAAQRLPVFGGFYGLVEAGGILSYESARTETVRLTGGYLKKIIAGAKAADLPIVQPTVFRLAINLKAAQALGLTVPPSLLARADEVIE